jgi:hypothetical protein
MGRYLKSGQLGSYEGFSKLGFSQIYVAAHFQVIQQITVQIFGSMLHRKASMIAYKIET